MKIIIPSAKFLLKWITSSTLFCGFSSILCEESGGQESLRMVYGW
jgi:hypothetical protein